jgi:hypothetical protein
VAFIDNEFISFFPEEAWSNLKGDEKAATLIHAWPRIAATIGTAGSGTCWRIPCAKREGVIKLFDEAFDELIIPAPVLQAARAAKIS